MSINGNNYRVKDETGVWLDVVKAQSKKSVQLALVKGRLSNASAEEYPELRNRLIRALPKLEKGIKQFERKTEQQLRQLIEEGKWSHAKKFLEANKHFRPSKELFRYIERSPARRDGHNYRWCKSVLMQILFSRVKEVSGTAGVYDIISTASSVDRYYSNFWEEKDSLWGHFNKNLKSMKDGELTEVDWAFLQRYGGRELVTKSEWWQSFFHRNHTTRPHLVFAILRRYLTRSSGDHRRYEMDRQAMIEMVVDREYTGLLDLLVKEGINEDQIYTQALSMGKAGVVKALLAKGDQPSADELRLATLKGHTDMVKVLLDEGKIGVDQPLDKFGTTALHLAAYTGKVEMVGLLLEKGATVEKKGHLGRTPLYYAAMFGHLGAVKLLATKDAKLDVESKVGDLTLTPVYHAYWNSHTEVVQYLQEQGASYSTLSTIAKEVRGLMDVKDDRYPNRPYLRER